jgi:hypothetical protein
MSSAQHIFERARTRKAIKSGRNIAAFRDTLFAGDKNIEHSFEKESRL